MSGVTGSHLGVKMPHLFERSLNFAWFTAVGGVLMLFSMPLIETGMAEALKRHQHLCQR
jgi:hypothetical protein